MRSSVALGVALCSLSPSARASEPAARVDGDDVVLAGPPGASVRLLGADERVLASGRLDSDGALVLRGQGSVDPMLRLLEIDGRRLALSDLFPPVELMAVLPPRLSAGLALTPHVRALHRHDGRAVPGVPVEIALRCGKELHVLGVMTSDGLGVAAPGEKLEVPAPVRGACTLIATGAGARLESAVSVTRGVRLVLSSDRPVYHPGHTVHLRALALDSGTGAPLEGEEATIELRDPRGAVLAREEVRTSAFGLANGQLVIPKGFGAEAVVARASVGGESVERRLRVGRYVPPRVLVSIHPDPTQRVRAGGAVNVAVRVARLDGAPAIGSSVELSALSDPDGAVLWRRRGLAGADGAVTLGGEIARKTKKLVLHARAETTGGEAQDASLAIGVDDGSLDVYVVPESGRATPGADNGFWVVTLLPNGDPQSAEATLAAGAARATGRTGADGIAFIRLPVPSGARTIEVRASAGDRSGTRALSMEDRGRAPELLLRVDPPVAPAGALLSLEVAAPGREGLAMVDLVQTEHPVRSVPVPLVRGAGKASLRLPDEASGAVRLSAWTTQGTRVLSDTRFVIVESARDLGVTLTPDKEVYEPRSRASVLVRVTDRRGQPKVAAVGLSVVDQGLSALGLEQPGIEQALARLGARWPEPRADVPEWVRDALFVAGDLRRLSVLAAAVETEVSLLPPVETGRARAAAASQAFRPALARRAERVAGALSRWYRGDRRRRGKVPSERDLLAGKLLVEADLDDPWGRRAALQIHVDGSCCQDSVELRSAGADGRANTADDVSAGAAFQGYRKGACACGHGFGARGTGAGGGGHAFGLAGVGRAGVAGAPPLRTHFPETLAIEPALITAPDGRATWSFPLADSLTRWLVQARAVSREGGLGAAESVIRVEQPFSVDASLPPSLTRLDEIEIPIGLVNRTRAIANVEVEAFATGSLEGRTAGTVTIPPGGGATASIRLRARGVGEGSLEIRARGGNVSDAVRRTLIVEADGVPVEEVRSGVVRTSEPVRVPLPIAQGGIPGTKKVTLRLYPSPLGAVVEGLDSLLRAPSGCFEQTSATTYPNALIIDYLRKTNNMSPELAARARALIDAGWKRLVSFEVPGGGFSWFGDAPANKILTAFGVMELERIANVLDVDRDVARRTRAWLLSMRAPDGSYAPDAAYLHADSWAKIQNASLPVTAYVVWALARGGEVADLAPSVAWIREHAHEAKDPYVQALVALALSAADGRGSDAADARHRLVSMASVEPEAVSWPTAMTTATHAGGSTANLETTGLASIALFTGGDHESLAQRGVSGLLARRSAGGGWGSTQATTLALEALLESAARSAQPAEGAVQITTDGRAHSRVLVTAKDFDVVRTVDVPAAEGARSVLVGIEMTGAGQLHWQLAATRNVPTEEAPGGSRGPLVLSVAPDRRDLAIGERVRISVHLLARASVRMPTISVGLPAGFEIAPESLAGIKASKHEVLGRRLILYLEHLAPGAGFEASFELVARRAGRLSPGLASAWPYYDPEGIVRVEQPRLTVRSAEQEARHLTSAESK